MAKTHITLTPDHQSYLTDLLSKGTLRVNTIKRATALLELNKGKTFGAVAQILNLTYQTVSSWATKYQTQQLTFLSDKPRSGRPLEIDGTQQAKVTALACSKHLKAIANGRSGYWLTKPSNSTIAPICLIIRLV